MSELQELRPTSGENVIRELELEKQGTDWAKKTNDFAVGEVTRFSKRPDTQWYLGIIGEKDIWNIILLGHNHEHELLLFPDNTSLHEAVKFFQNRDPHYSPKCVKLVNELKQSISDNGFTSKIILREENKLLVQIDGLHRLIALGLIILEGKSYPRVEVMINK